MSASADTGGGLEFVVPAGQHAAPILDDLAAQFQIDAPEVADLRLTFYDSFDWRIWRRAMMLCHEQRGAAGRLRCSTFERRLVYATECQRAPRFAGELAPSPLRQRLAKMLAVRALLELGRLRCRCRVFAVRNEDRKIVARLRHERFTVVAGRAPAAAMEDRLSVMPLRGFDTEGERVRAVLEAAGLQPPGHSLLELALVNSERRPGDYSSKLTVRLDAGAQASIAVAAILETLFASMRVNEPGIRGDWDSEFLHDFRVAVRRTRSALTQIKGLFDDPRLARFREDFAWLGAVTGPKRDLDVHVLDFDRHCTAVPADLRQDLEPLREHLKARREAAGRELIEALDSDRYRRFCRDWEQFLADAAAGKSAGRRGAWTVRAVADQRIWRVYRGVLRDGRAITDASPAGDLHELRKTCKKLRYLMEFFESLYPIKRVRRVIAQLKRLQDNLGSFQDQSVQTDSLRKAANALASAAPADTLLAMGALIERLRADHQATRAAFAQRFAAFDQRANRKRFTSLFRPEPQAPEAHGDGP